MSRILSNPIEITAQSLLGRRQAVRHQVLVLTYLGSNPSAPDFVRQVRTNYFLIIS